MASLVFTLKTSPLSIFIHLFSLYFNPTYQNLILSYTNKLSTLLSNSLWILTIFFFFDFLFTLPTPNLVIRNLDLVLVFCSFHPLISIYAFFFFGLFIDRGTFYLELNKPLILWPEVKPNSQFNFPNLLTPNPLIFPYF